MCNLDEPGDVCDCVVQLVEIVRQGEVPKTGEINELIARVVQIARAHAANDERRSMIKYLVSNGIIRSDVTGMTYIAHPVDGNKNEWTMIDFDKAGKN